MTSETIDMLNSYSGDVWEIIPDIPGYDEAATAAIDPGAASDRFAAAGAIYRFDAASRAWYVVVD